MYVRVGVGNRYFLLGPVKVNPLPPFQRLIRDLPEVLQDKLRANGTPKLGKHLGAQLGWKPFSLRAPSGTSLYVYHDPELKVPKG